MKVLWFSNRGILNSNISGSGSWLYSMSQNLVKYHDVEMANITDSPSVKTIKEESVGRITEWTLPKERLANGLPSKRLIKEIEQIVHNYKPDIIHVWGVENYWGLLFSRGYICNYKTLLEIQGLLFSCSDFYRNNLYWREFYNTQPLLKACYSFAYVYFQSVKFNKRLKYENEILQHFANISYQSNWTRKKLEYKVNANLFYSLRPIRPQFLRASKWQCPDCPINILTIASSEPYKGLHVTIKAIALLKNKYPEIKLSVAGVSLTKVNSGYIQYICDLIKHLKLEDTVELLGSLKADKLIEKMHSSSCLVISSFVESYSAVFAEAMCIGIPTVVAYSGAMPEFAQDGQSALFYTPGDHYQCAGKIGTILSDSDLAISISRNEVKLAIKNDELDVANTQMLIYNKI